MLLSVKQSIFASKFSFNLFAEEKSISRTLAYWAPHSRMWVTATNTSLVCKLICHLFESKLQCRRGHLRCVNRTQPAPLCNLNSAWSEWCHHSLQLSKYLPAGHSFVESAALLRRQHAYWRSYILSLKLRTQKPFG